jgi:molybdopterin synthase catalytic subunit
MRAFAPVAQRFPAAEPMLETVKDNYQMWKMEAMLESHSSSKGNL